MANLIEQLQSEAIDQSIPLSTLLRKVKLIASKLKLSETVQWVDAELQGYGQNIADYPNYRYVEGRVKAFSRYHGWQAPAGDSAMIKALSNRQIADSVSSIEDILSRDSNGTLTLPIPIDVERGILSSNVGWTEIHTEIQRTALISILDNVRTLVLNWSLELESKEISGEGVNFSEKERAIAKSSSISIEHFHGNLHSGDISGIQNRVNQGSSDNSHNTNNQESVFGEIEKASENLDEDTKETVKSLVRDMRSYKDKPSLFLSAYSKIVSIAADHAALLPFIPALAAFIPS